MSDSRTDFEVIVVGAGPAGITAATVAAQGGRRVCLLERKPVAGVPVRCGEGIGLKGFSLGVDVRPEWIQTTIRNATLVSPSGLKVTIPNIPQSFIINRERMESDLLADAVKAGAVYHPLSPVTSVRREADGRYRVVCPSVNYLASCLIIADGVESRLARDLGWKTALALVDIETCAFARVSTITVAADTISLILGRSVAPRGYAWIFPRNSTAANVGLGILGTHSAPGRARELLMRLIAQHFPDGSVTDVHCGGAPVAQWVKPLVRDGAMLVGDAARQVNAVAGAGIAYSLIAGRAAGQAAADAWRQGRFDPSVLRTYEQAWAAHYGKQQLRSYALKQMVITYEDAMLDRIARALQRKRGSGLNYLTLFLTAFSRHPLLMFKAYKLFR